jgi:hypothetical protein
MVYQLVVQSFLKVQDRHCLVTEEDETTHIIIEEEEEMRMVKVRLDPVILVHLVL